MAATLDVLVGLLDGLHDPKAEQPTPAVSMAALAICEEVAAHLRIIIQPAQNAAAEKAHECRAVAIHEPANCAPDPAPDAADPAPGAVDPEPDAADTAPASLAESSATSDDTAGGASVQKPNRLSKKNRDRLRRRQAAAEEEFRQSFWNQGWQMAPTMPAPSQASFVDAMWSGGWQMVPMVTAAPQWTVDHAQASEAGTTGPETPPSTIRLEPRRARRRGSGRDP